MTGESKRGKKMRGKRKNETKRKECDGWNSDERQKKVQDSNKILNYIQKV